MFYSAEPMKPRKRIQHFVLDISAKSTPYSIILGLGKVRLAKRNSGVESL